MLNDRLIFVSVGSTANQEQEDFVCAVEERLRSEGMTPQTVNRNLYTSDAPLIAIRDLMEKCSGVVVIALERTYFATGTEKRGGAQQHNLVDIKLPTPWNQIEAAMAYARELPLLMMLESGLREEGLLDRGFDWYLHKMIPSRIAATSSEFNGVFFNWKQKVEEFRQPLEVAIPSKFDAAVSEWTIGQVVANLKPAQLWSFLAAVVGLVSAAFLLGLHLKAIKI